MSGPTLAQSNPYFANSGAYASAQTAGNCNLLVVEGQNTGGASTLTASDTANGSYALLATINDNSAFGRILYYFVFKNIASAGAGTNTVSLTPTNLSGVAFWAEEWNGVIGDLIGSATGTGASGTSLTTSTSVTTTAPNQLAISSAFANGQVYTQGSGWTFGDSQLSGTLGWEYQIPASSGTAVTGTATQNLSDFWVIGLIVLTVPGALRALERRSRPVTAAACGA